MEVMYWKFPTWEGFENYVYRVLSKDRLVRDGVFYCAVHHWIDTTPVIKVDNVEHHGVRCNADGSPRAVKAPAPAPVDAWSTQVGGDHYRKLPIQPLQYSMANSLDPMQHTIIKYVTRFRDKGGLIDLNKAKQTIDLLIAFEQSKEK